MTGRDELVLRLRDIAEEAAAKGFSVLAFTLHFLADALEKEGAR